MEVRTILWPTDLSQNSIKAAKHVSSLADKYQARVVLLFVGVDLKSFPTYYGEVSDEHLKHFQEFEVKQARKRLQAVCDENLKSCPNIQVKLVQGDPASEILKAIGEEKADMVVLTTHGRGQEQLDQITASFGSVADKVLRNSPVPVHLVNPLRD
jgi:nucleotide-binding universal stress UspA family protein